MPPDLVEELRAWSDGIFARSHVRYEIRYQGSDLFVYTERGWSAMAPEQQQRVSDDPGRFPDPMATRTIDLPAQLAVCRGDRAGEPALRTRCSSSCPSPHTDRRSTGTRTSCSGTGPKAATPWPTRIFLSYYLVDTTRENGCLRVIPGSHRTRHRLHDILPDAHGEELQALEDLSHPAFADYPGAVDVPLGAGDLLIADARLLHAAWPNRSDRRRTLLLAWHDAFSFPEPAELVDRGDPRRRQERRPHGAVRSHQDPQPLHRLTACSAIRMAEDS